MSDPARTELEASTRGGALRAQYALVFVVLGVLTLVELGVVRMPGISTIGLRVALVTIAIAKAALIALFYMHLRFETPILRMTVLLPLVAPAIYGLILIAEAGARAMR